MWSGLGVCFFSWKPNLKSSTIRRRHVWRWSISTNSTLKMFYCHINTIKRDGTYHYPQRFSKGSKLSTKKAFWSDVHAWGTIKTPRSLSKAPIGTQLPRDYTLQKRPAEKCQPFLGKSVYYLGSRGRNFVKKAEKSSSKSSLRRDWQFKLNWKSDMFALIHKMNIGT